MSDAQWRRRPCAKMISSSFTQLHLAAFYENANANVLDVSTRFESLSFIFITISVPYTCNDIAHIHSVFVGEKRLKVIAVLIAAEEFYCVMIVQ